MFNIKMQSKSRDYNHRLSREKMVEEQIMSRGVMNKKVCDTLKKIPRHKFVSENLLYQAYKDSPLPIGDGQTISQPLMVAIMTEHLEITRECKILEIGTGSGYQTAILAELSDRVFSIERMPTLCLKAESLLRELGYKNITLSIGDGTLGLKKEAPFDRIIVTAGTEDIPETLVEQLGEGGIMVIPVGSRNCQTLQIIKKLNNKIKISQGCQCTFVKLIGEQGYKE